MFPHHTRMSPEPCLSGSNTVPVRFEYRTCVVFPIYAAGISVSYPQRTGSTPQSGMIPGEFSYPALT